MKITWYGTASLVLETSNASILIDPYTKFLPKGRETEEQTKEREQAFKNQKNILITHGHFDHLSSVPALFLNVDCKVYLTKTPYDTMNKNGFNKEKMQVIDFGDTLTFGDIEVKVLKGKHIKFVKKEIVYGFLTGIFKKHAFIDFCRAMKIGKFFFSYPENDETIFYEIRAEGKLIQVMGSADLDENVSYAENADILILPHQGRKDIDVQNKKIVEKLKPKRVLLDHFDDAFPPFTTEVSTKAFIEEVSKITDASTFVECVAVEI